MRQGSGVHSMKILMLGLMLAVSPAWHAAMAQDPGEETGSTGVAAEAGKGDAAQSGKVREMSVEELEAFIAKRRAELAAVEKNRAETEAKAARVREAIDKREADLQKIQSELESLCKDREKIKTGSFDQCMAANGTGDRAPGGTEGKPAGNGSDVVDDG